jgi:hypothetical protein
MTKAKSKRTPASRANDSKIKTRNSVRRTTARKESLLKPVTMAVHQQPGPRRSRLHAVKAKGSHHCNVACARWRHRHGDGTGCEVATPFGAWLPRRCRAQEARADACLGRRREWARLPDHGSHGVSGGRTVTSVTAHRIAGKLVARLVEASLFIASSSFRLQRAKDGHSIQTFVTLWCLRGSRLHRE